MDTSGLPGPSLLSVSNRHGLLFFPVKFGFGWAQLSNISSGVQSLDYNKFDLDHEQTSAVVVGGLNEEWLVIGNDQCLYLFNLDKFASDPV